MKAARVFTRDDPCTKVHLWNCFHDEAGQWTARPLVDAKMEIGDNAPKYLMREGYMVQRIANGIDWYELTWRGKDWLRQGTMRYLELHPDKVVDCRHPPVKTPNIGKRVLRRTRS